MGKIMNRFLDFMHLNDYEEDDYDDYDDSDYEEEMPRPVKKSVSKKESTYKEEETDQEEQDRKARFKPVKGKVIPMKTSNKGMEVCGIKPSTVEDGREISDTLLSGRAVILNLEGLQVSIAQRIIDFTSGACYSINGNLQKVSHYIFIITPESVDISGDFQDLLSNTGNFDVSAFQGSDM